ncbi:hypothetical protein PAAG_08984 [Paracoccidioides lutzii Pb01]|uniref:Uncharacterized protein n=1 Tax=Paracoccidioides lutzii (strain ATCC MYA-826 / Pb01) TaxID=502779 RepID=C1HDZ1_PARBA|nr:hypothetical protein PAAG_08984 [Paracoccidioides lutzii Pb01]EEH40135.2 hypothetical protein PAAG_08984 [Paracoccidioides lutzii Pb01]
MEINQTSLREKVTNAFRERNIPVKRDEIAAALTDAESCKWIKSHLGPDNLLSKEESALYAKLEATGSLKSILQGQEISSTRPFLDDEIRDAIGSLRASTAAIENQTETLKLQCKELKSQIRSPNQSRQRESRAWGQLNKKHALEKQQTDVTVEDLTHEFETSLGAVQSLLSTESSTLLPMLAGKLKDDDRSMLGLEKIASTVQIDGDDKELSRRATQLTAKLAGYLAEEIHSRLDRLYLEAIHNGASGADQGEDKNTQLATFQEEINSLYSEIEILSEMTTQQQFKVPILRALQSRGTETRSTSQQQLEQILDTIIQLTQSAERITERLINRQSHRIAINYLSTKYKSEQDKKQSEQQTNISTTAQKQISRLSYAPSTPGNTERKSSIPLPLDHGSKALEQLLRRLGVSIVDLVESGLAENTSASLDGKKQHMLEMLQNLQSTAESPLSVHLGPADQTAQLLHSALYADSNFEVSMADGAPEQRLSSLECQIEALRKGIDGLNVDILHGEDKAQKKFMERWG